MHFFLPGANNPEEARSFYSRIRNQIQQRHGQLRDSRIFRVAFPYDGKKLTLAVGDSLHMAGGEPILAILEGRDFYVCTRRHGAVEGDPVVIPRTGAVKVEAFQ